MEALTVIVGYRNCVNLLPYFFWYYKQVADEIIVFDNGSTDGSREIAELAGAQVYDLDYHGDDIRQRLEAQQEAYRGVKDGWVAMVDYDEFIVPPVGFQGRLKDFCEQADGDAMISNPFNMMPLDGENYRSRRFLWEAIPHGYPDGIIGGGMDKPNLVRAGLGIEWRDGFHGLLGFRGRQAPQRPVMLHYRLFDRAIGLAYLEDRAKQISEYNREHSIADNMWNPRNQMAMLWRSNDCVDAVAMTNLREVGPMF